MLLILCVIVFSLDKTMGPSPFPVVQGAGIMVSAFKTEQKGEKTGYPFLKTLFVNFMYAPDWILE